MQLCCQMAPRIGAPERYSRHLQGPSSKPYCRASQTGSPTPTNRRRRIGEALADDARYRASSESGRPGPQVWCLSRSGDASSGSSRCLGQSRACERVLFRPSSARLGLYRGSRALNLAESTPTPYRRLRKVLTRVGDDTSLGVAPEFAGAWPGDSRDRT